VYDFATPTTRTKNTIWLLESDGHLTFFKIDYYDNALPPSLARPIGHRAHFTIILAKEY
jgi:hypothetical protein